MTDRRHDRGASRDPRHGRHGRSATVDNPRRIAYEVLAAVSTQDAYANLVLPKLLRHRGVSGRDAAFATELSYGTLRRRGSLDAVIASASGRAVSALDQSVADVLRLGVYQLLYTRVAAHAAANTTVSLARKVCGHRPAGFVNAVMRKVSRYSLEDWLDKLSTGEELADLALRQSHPEWIVRRFAEALAGPSESGSASGEPSDSGAGPTGPAELRVEVDETGFLPETYPTAVRRDESRAAATDSPAGAVEPHGDTDGAEAEPDELVAALAADNVSPAVQLCARPGLIDATELARQTDGSLGRWSAYAVELDSGDPGDLAAIRDGRAHVQDEGSQLVALALAAAPLTGRDERWLDLCAGPGGKAALLGSLAARRDAKLTAVEVAEHRARLVAETTKDLDVDVVTADGRTYTTSDSFDRVLVDAPCSGLGALRRRPEARWRRAESDLDGLRELQTELLASALRLVRPGGVVAYVTCSPVIAETHEIVATATGASLVDARPLFPAELPHLGDGPTVQLWPHRHGTDAMFCAILRRD
ncbi:RsmB/NOP family class I SAM-dependent RNA methyltransferase [Stackebrandtia nassauensis]|uniref:Fmu (Sun) domain protein n=1 Tax=Stackebrandtia nassauensis (strain DSM 44728 / CIP 108903 / NRRL B-16338 / NBRC 102104 / LLR-40K-21) TaxID=446470 RepID=D3Q681_STANL|nr:transcription antitermination factor NusB [Stackebrandtia nassauensis]ADD42256.1 Fmu (Sun) domain protein [Stackebrandtia nassauensis DSM 44728]